jgi:hypothetical protein
MRTKAHCDDGALFCMERDTYPLFDVPWGFCMADEVLTF